MARIIVKATNIFFDDKAYKKAVQKAIEKEFNTAVKKWLIAVLVRTPTYTGTARGTYAPLGRVVGHAVRKGIIKGNAANAAKKRFFRYGGQIFPLGFSAGANYSDFSITKTSEGGRSVFTFEFDQQLPYVLWNEIQPGPSWFNFQTSPPWLAMKAGNKAFRNHMNNFVKTNFPKLNLFIKSTSA